MTTKFIGVKEFRKNMAKISTQAQKNNQRLIILRKNEPIFELIPLSKKESNLEKISLEIEEGLNDLKEGNVISHADVKKRFGLD